jgi:hypothetical protein
MYSDDASSFCVSTAAISGRFSLISRCILLIAIVFIAISNLWSQSITQDNWGAVTAPVYGSSETGAYADAELFAGPNKFGSYFSGVLPNGRIVTPAGTTIQIGMNPLAGC